VTRDIDRDAGLAALVDGEVGVPDIDGNFGLRTGMNA